MRKFNAVLSMTIFALFLFHVIVGSFTLFGFTEGGSAVMQIVTWVMLLAVCVHAVIGIKLTIDTLTAIRKSGANYFKENKLFWVRRISGFAVMLFIISHIIIFMGHNGADGYRLNLFDVPQLILSVLLVLTLVLHIVTNIRPLMTALGARSGMALIGDIAFVLSVVLFAAGIAFVVYFVSWSV